MNDVSVFVGQNLHFDMAGFLEIFFHINHVAGKSCFGFGAGHGVGFLHFLVVEGYFHALAAAAGRGFDDDRIADFVGPFNGHFDAFQCRRARSYRNAGFLRNFAGGNFVAHQTHLLGSGTDESNAVAFDHFGEVGVFGQKAEPGMDGVGAGNQRGGNNCRFV